MRTDWRTMPLLLACLTTIVAGVGAQEPDTADIGWSNATELSVVRTGGNADTQTFGFKNTLRRNWTRARRQLA